MNKICCIYVAGVYERVPLMHIQIQICWILLCFFDIGLGLSELKGTVALVEVYLLYWAIRI